MTRNDADVIVVGGGIAGASLGYELATRGLEVLLIERGRSPLGASTIPAALLNPHRGRTARARQLDLDGLEAFWQLTERLANEGLDHGAHRSGVLRAASNARQATAWQRLAASSATTGLAWLEPSEFPAAYHAPFGGLQVTHGGWLEPASLLSALGSAAAGAGSRSVMGLHYRGWRPARNGGVVVEVQADGQDAPEVADSRQVLHAARLVLCLGAYDSASCRLPRLEVAPGVAATFNLVAGSGQEPVTGSLPPLAGAVGITVRGREAIVSGGVLPHLSGPVARASLAEAAERLRATASWSLPVLERASLSYVWHGSRARRPSGNPVVRSLAQGVTLFAGLAGRGFLSGPLLASRLAERMAAGSLRRPPSPTNQGCEP